MELLHPSMKTEVATGPDRTVVLEMLVMWRVLGWPLMMTIQSDKSDRFTSLQSTSELNSSILSPVLLETEWSLELLNTLEGVLAGLLSTLSSVEPGPAWIGTLRLDR